MAGYSWTLAQRSLELAPDCCVALLDSVAPQQQYRVIAKILSRPGQVVRASFHDYRCDRYEQSVAYFDTILTSLSFVESAAGAPGTLLH